MNTAYGAKLFFHRFHAFRALKSFNFRLWTYGGLVSNTGTWMQRVAQDWLVLTQLTPHDATAVGTVTALQFAPQFLLLPWVGIAADRFDQRRLLIFTQGAMGVSSLALGMLTISGCVQLWHVYIFAFVSGAVAALDGPVRQTFVGELVGDEDLHSAVSLNATSFNAAQMIGPAIAGLVIAQIGTGWAFVFNGLSFGAVLMSMFFLCVNDLQKRPKAARTPGAFLEGFHYVWNRSDLRTILLMLFLIGTFGLNFPIFISTMAVNVFHTDARAFGLLSSTMAIGTLTGSLIAAATGKATFRSLLVGSATFAVGCTLAAIAPGYWWFAASLAVIGVAALVFMMATNSIMQLTTDATMRGRVMALRIGVSLGGTPIGAPIVGWVAHLYGPRWGLCIGAAAGMIAALIAIVHMKETDIKRELQSLG